MATDAERNRGSGAYTTPGVDEKPETGPSKIITSSPVVTFRLQQVEPPSAQYISATDSLALTAANSDPNVVAVTFVGKILRAADGLITPFNHLMPIGSARAVTTQLFGIAEGYLLDLELTTNPGTQRGRCYVQARVVRGNASNFTEYAQLISDYCSRGHNPKYPNGQYIASVESVGILRTIVGTVPAAGANVSETVPTGARWKLKSFRTNFTTSATVANRQVRITIDDGVNTTYAAYAANVQTAGLIFNYDFSAAGPAAVAFTNDSSIPGPGEIPMMAGGRIRTAVDALQAGDQFTAPIYQVEEWIEL